MMACWWGNHECARLVREYSAKDDRNIDELVEFISGQTDKKKRGEKRKNMGQSGQAENTETTTSSELHKVMKNETTDNSDSLEPTEVDIINNPGRAKKRNTELIDFYKVKIDL